MVFTVSLKYLQGQDGNKIVEWMRGCLLNYHYIECDASCIQYIKGVMDLKASEKDRALLSKSRETFDVPVEIKDRMQIIKANNYSMDILIVLSSEPAVMILENLRELDVYKAIAQAYCKDRTYGWLFQHLCKRMQSTKAFSGRQAGGFGDIKMLLNSLDDGGYVGQARVKAMSVFDRDTNSASEYDANKNHLFLLFLDKKSDSVEEKDIYSTTPQFYHWHMWYKRAIENYFSVNQFKGAGCRLKPDYDREKSEDYMPVNDRYFDYNKNKLGKLTKGMTFQEYERRLKSFDVNGQFLSEFQIFLFKIMQIV